MGALRTPDELFADLPGYPYPPSYVDVAAAGVDPVRMHFVDAGPPDGPVALLLHGQPTWSYLYRRVIPVLAGSGMRVVAPDHIGFGRSDKPGRPTDYTFTRHMDWMGSFVNALDLREVTMVAQDWGGPIGLSVLARQPDRFARVVATNTVLHTCEADLAGRLGWANHADGGRMIVEQALLDYVAFCQRAPELRASVFVDAVGGPLDPGVRAAYDAPYPSPDYQAGMRQMTALIPLTPNDPGAVIGRATMRVLSGWSRPFLTAFSDGDPATRGWETVFQERIPGARGQQHVTIAGAGHFVQEQRGEELGAIVADFVRTT